MPLQKGLISSIGQQIMFNSTKTKRSKSDPNNKRHNKEKETPASVYMAMKLHLLTGSKSLVDTMNKRGLCVSYYRLRRLSTDLANSIISYWEKIGVVVPPQAIKGVFTTGGYDNIDHNPSSLLAKTHSMAHA